MRHSIFLLLLLASPAFSAGPVYTWQTRADDPDRVYLYRDGTQIGGWCYRAGQYRAFDGQNWGQPSASPPVQPPQRASLIRVSSWQSSPRYRGLRGRIGAAMGSILEAEARRFMEGPFVDIMVDAVIKGMKSMIDDGLFASVDLYCSVKLFAQIEMDGEFKDTLDADDKLAKELLANGSAKLILSERDRFAQQLNQEGFSNPVLVLIRTDVEIQNSFPMDGSDQAAQAQSILLFKTRDWNEDPPKMIDSSTPAIPWLINHRFKDAKDKIPITAHFSLVFSALKEHRAHLKSLSFDLYLESLERQKIEPASNPWKIRNLDYK